MQRDVFFQLRSTDNIVELNDFVLTASKMGILECKFPNYLRIRIEESTFAFHCFIWENVLQNKTLNGKAVVKISIDGEFRLGRPPFLYFVDLNKTNWPTLSLANLSTKERFFSFLQSLGALEKQHKVYPHQER